MSHEQSGRRIVNIINFIRAVEPREVVDLLEPVANQVRLVKQHNLPATFLLQYDALLEPRFTDLLKKELDGRYDIGAWLEIVQPQVEKAGLKWRGRFPWDWHAHVGFSIGYTPAEREKLIDVLMEQFKQVFGKYPFTVGSWFMDAHSLRYLADRYGVGASCWCKDQIGTDGYTVWGGYWNQGYYPSQFNAYMPAQTAEGQIPVPVFRMLGSDPIYQYDAGLGTQNQGVVTLEPAYRRGGGSSVWVRWFFDAMLRQPCLACSYAQVGQENSFGWPRMKEGLTDQIQFLAEQVKRGRVVVETLADSCRWFASKFPLTPATAITALNDWQYEGRKSVWYESRFYRTNLFWDGEQFRIRDIHRFDQRYAERYLRDTCRTTYCVYDTLPVLDGFQWSTKESIAGMRLVEIRPDGTRTVITGGDPVVSEPGADELRVDWPLHGGGSMRITCQPGRMMIGVPDRPAGSWAIELSWAAERTPAIQRVEDQLITYQHQGFAYAVPVASGRCERQGSNRVIVRPGREGIILQLDCLK